MLSQIKNKKNNSRYIRGKIHSKEKHRKRFCVVSTLVCSVTAVAYGGCFPFWLRLDKEADLVFFGLCKCILSNPKAQSG